MLYRQGVFWTAYEQSAYRIWQEKQYQLTVKFIKDINRSVLSLDFPDSVLKVWQNKNKDALTEKADNYSLFSSPDLLDENEFLCWRQNLETKAHYKNEEEKEDVEKNSKTILCK